MGAVPPIHNPPGMEMTNLSTVQVVIAVMYHCFKLYN